MAASWALLLLLQQRLLLAQPPPGRAASTVGRLPVMGYSNWYDTKCDVHAERFTEAAAALEKHGMRQLGYTQINVDAGWALPQRDGTTHELVADPRFFPRGMANLSADLAARGFQLGGYTDRGAQQCGPSAGSKGYEKLDAELFASWNLSYVKSDDCNATLEYGPAMADYDRFATALAAAGAARGGAEIYFLICGCKLGVGAPDPRAGWEQCPRDASKTRGIAAWRIASDDYMWPNILLNANIFAGLTQFGSSGKFNDPDMLINQPMVGAGWPSEEVCPNLEAWKGVRKRGFPPYSITPKQARLQMALWCTMGAPLILSMNIRNLSDYDLETYSNAEAIAVDQCPLVLPGVRLQGYNLSATAIAPPSPAPPLPNGSTVIANYNIVQGQCDACSRGPTGCCVKGAPNPLVQYLSHKKAMTLVACESLCRTWPQRDHRADNATAATTTASTASTASSIPSPRCHSFVWNSKNYDCFGRLDNAFDASNPRYSHSPGLFSGRLSNESVAAEVVAAAVGADGGRRTATAAEEELARGDSEPPPPPPPFGNWSTTNIWGKKLANGSFALTFINVGTTSAPPLTCDPACISKLLGREDGGATPVKGARYRVRDIWAKRDLPELVAPLSVSSPTLEAGSGMHMVRLWPAP